MAQAGCMPPSRQGRTSSSLDELAIEGSRVEKKGRQNQPALSWQLLRLFFLLQINSLRRTQSVSDCPGISAGRIVGVVIVRECIGSSSIAGA